MHSVVIDTVVWLRALINPKSKAGLLLFKHHKNLTIFLSYDITREIIEVLTRPELAKRRPEIQNLPDLQLILKALSKATNVRPERRIEISRDSKDNKFLEAAVSGKADYIISEDKDLLDLKEFEGIKIVDIKSFLKIIDDEI